MEVTSATHTSGNGESTLGYLQLHIGMAGALVNDGSQVSHIGNFLRMAQEAVDKLQREWDDGTFKGQFPIVARDAGTGEVIEMTMGFSSQPTTAQRHATREAKVVTRWNPTTPDHAEYSRVVEVESEQR